jgi:RimJ/RimL family protein N-acetyltransferase
MGTGVVIFSPRLVMRPFLMSDCDQVLEYQSNPDVVRFVPWPVRDAAMVADAITRSLPQDHFEVEGDYLSLALVRAEDDQLIGQMNAMFVSAKDQCADIGYVLNPRFTNCGYASEAARALINHLFDTALIRRVTATLDERNVASRRVAERLGLRREALFFKDRLFNGEWTSTLIYATLRDEWVR